MVDERRRIPLAALIVGACALVAAAARSDLADGTAAAFALDRRANTLTGIAIAASTLLAVALVVWATWGTGKAKAPLRRRSWRDTVAFVVAVLLLGLLLATLDPPERSRDQGVDGSAELGGNDGADAVDDGPAPRASATGSVLVALGAILVLGLAIAATRARRVRPLDASLTDTDDWPPDLSVQSTEAAGIARAIEAARSSSDPRASIVLAYRAAELALRRGPLRRPPSVAPREWLAEIRSRAGSGSEVHLAMRTLTNRYEIARFSTHAPSSLDREAALAALDVIATQRATMLA